MAPINPDYSIASLAEKSPPVVEGWVVYLLSCADGSLYAGVSANLARRLRQHNGELTGGARYTRPRRPVTLVWYQQAEDRSEAQRLEARLKQMSRAAKHALIQAQTFLEESCDGV